MPIWQWLKWSCEAGGSSDEARLEQTPYPFHTQLIWRYLGIKYHLIDSIRGARSIAGGLKSKQRAEPLTLTTEIWSSDSVLIENPK